ncbi:MAG: hypothetical protein ACKOAX_07045 [Candidatus Kapaibacterium sp.]
MKGFSYCQEDFILAIMMVVVSAVLQCGTQASLPVVCSGLRDTGKSLILHPYPAPTPHVDETSRGPVSFLKRADGG